MQTRPAVRTTSTLGLAIRCKGSRRSSHHGLRNHEPISPSLGTSQHMAHNSLPKNREEHSCRGSLQVVPGAPRAEPRAASTRKPGPLSLIPGTAVWKEAQPSQNPHKNTPPPFVPAYENHRNHTRPTSPSPCFILSFRFSYLAMRAAYSRIFAFFSGPKSVSVLAEQSSAGTFGVSPSRFSRRRSLQPTRTNTTAQTAALAARMQLPTYSATPAILLHANPRKRPTTAHEDRSVLPSQPSPNKIGLGVRHSLRSYPSLIPTFPMFVAPKTPTQHCSRKTKG